MAVVKPTIKPTATVAPKRTSFKDNWISLENSSDAISTSYSVDDFVAAGFRLKNKIALNSNGNPYLFCVDTETQTGSAIYLSNGLKAKLLGVDEVQDGQNYSDLEGVTLTKNDINIIVLETEEGPALIIARKGQGGEDWF